METGLLIVRIIATVLIGLIGVQIAIKLKLPAPFMLGAMASTLLFGMLTRQAYFPTEVKPVVQAIAGGAIGINMTREAVYGLKRIVAPAAAYVAALIVVATSAALLITAVTDISPVTALLACSPGGVVDMSLLSYDFAANTAQITVLQMMRLTIGLGVFPSLTIAVVNKFDKHDTDMKIAETHETITKEKQPFKMAVPTILILSIGCIIGVILQIPAGALTIPMILISAYQMKTNKAAMSPKFRKGAQSAAGIMAGLSMTTADIKTLSMLMVPACIILAEFLFLTYCIGPIISKLFHLDLTTTLLACTPAGVTDMALIAEDVGGDQTQVAAFQLLRLTTALVAFPFIAYLFVIIFN